MNLALLGNGVAVKPGANSEGAPTGSITTYRLIGKIDGMGLTKVIEKDGQKSQWEIWNVNIVNTGNIFISVA